MKRVRHLPMMLMVAVSLSGSRAACDHSSLAMSDIVAPVLIQESPENEAVIVKLPKNTLRIFYTLQPTGAELRSITSTDGGLSWGHDKREVTIPGQAVFCLQALATQDGELHAFVLVRRGSGTKYGIDLFLDIWHWQTTGHGSEWKPGKRIYEGVVGAMRGVTQLKSGRILLPVGMWLAGRRPGLPTGCHEVSAIYSDDGGDTWVLSASRLVAPCYEAFNGSNYGACEPNVLEVDNGRVWMLMRTQTGRLYQSHSHDGGSTWSDAVPSEFVSSDSPAEIMRLSDDRTIVLWNNCQNPARVNGKLVAGGRDVLHAAISIDNCKSWRGCREVYRDPLRDESPPRRGDRGTAYSTAVMNEDGKVVLCTGQGQHRRAVLIFDPEWLLATHREDDFSNGLDGWCSFTEFGEPESPVFRDRTSGPELVDHPSKDNASVIHIRRPVDKPGDGAVWNFPAATRGTLKLRILLNRGFQGANIALGDQFYNPSDCDGEMNAIYGLPIDAYGKMFNHGPLPLDTWHTLELQWDQTQQQCHIYVDEKEMLALPMLHPARHGLSYLRIRSTAEAADSAGLLLESVSMHASKEVDGYRSKDVLR